MANDLKFTGWLSWRHHFPYCCTNFSPKGGCICITTTIPLPPPHLWAHYDLLKYTSILYLKYSLLCILKEFLKPHHMSILFHTLLGSKFSQGKCPMISHNIATLFERTIYSTSSWFSFARRRTSSCICSVCFTGLVQVKMWWKTCITLSLISALLFGELLSVALCDEVHFILPSSDYPCSNN